MCMSVAICSEYGQSTFNDNTPPKKLKLNDHMKGPYGSFPLIVIKIVVKNVLQFRVKL